MSFSEWIISRTGGQTMVHVKRFYTTVASVNPAHSKKIKDAKICMFLQGLV